MLGARTARRQCACPGPSSLCRSCKACRRPAETAPAAEVCVTHTRMSSGFHCPDSHRDSFPQAKSTLHSVMVRPPPSLPPSTHGLHMHGHMCTHTYAHTHTCVHGHTHTQAHMHTHRHTHVHTHACGHTHAHWHTRAHVCAHIHASTCVCTHTHGHMRTHRHTCACTHTLDREALALTGR